MRLPSFLWVEDFFQLILNVFHLELTAVALHFDFKHQLNFEKRIEQVLIQIAVLLANEFCRRYGYRAG